MLRVFTLSIQSSITVEINPYIFVIFQLLTFLLFTYSLITLLSPVNQVCYYEKCCLKTEQLSETIAVIRVPVSASIYRLV
jgi:hypothetical protein